MRITLAPVGTASDVLPVLALAKALHARGHLVTLCAAEEFRSLIYKTGFQLFSNGKSYRNYLEAESTSEDSSGELARILGEDIATHFVALRDATRHADVIVGARLQLAGPSLAEQLKIPYLYLVTTPGATDYDLFPIFGVAQDRLQKRRSKRLKDWDELVLTSLNRERKLTHLPPVTSLFEHLYRSGEIIMALDPAIVPVKQAMHQSVTGFCFFDEEFDVDDALAAFLNEGAAPIYIAPFRMKNPLQITALCDSLTKAGHRVVLGYGWPETKLPAGCHGSSSFSYTQIFPRVSVVVHGGASDVAVHAIRARVPQVVAPYTAEQAYWALKVSTLGASPAPVPFGDATKMLESIEQALQMTDGVKAAAPAENGAEATASIIEHVVERHRATTESR